MLNKYLLHFLFLSFTTTVNSGGIDNNLSKKNEILDEILLRVVYEFKQVAFIEDESLIQTDTMSLLMGNTFSLYTTYNKSEKDSLFNVAKKEVNLQREIVIHWGNYEEFVSNINFNNDIGSWKKDWETADLFKNRRERKLTIIDELDDVGIIKVEETNPIENWEIGTDTLTILGYTCRDATIYYRGREYTAWFAQEISINDGPWKFYGLPGLILRIEDSNKLFRFNAIGIESVRDNTQIILVTNNKYQMPTLQQYNKLKINNKNKVHFYKLQGSELNMFHSENHISYNPIELEE
jgi:GLPGLI family protein